VTDRRDTTDEQRCLALGDLLAEALPGPDAAAGALPADLAAAFDGAPPRRRRWRRPLALSFLGAAAAAGVAVWMTARARPLEYAVDGAVAEADGFFEASARRPAQARFSDGTVVSLEPGAAAQIKDCTHDGATVAMTRGSASFAVKHRLHASWHVEIGRFDIAVTGTEFEVRNANPVEGFELRMKSGAVLVRGPLTGSGIPLYGGQRLVASLAQRTLLVGEVNRAPALPPPPPAPPVRALPAVETREAPPRRVRTRTRPVALAAAEPIAPPPPAPADLQPPRFEPPPEIALPPSTPQPPSVEPAPAPAPPTVGVGGAACNEGPTPQISFDRPGELAGIGAGPQSAMANPVLDDRRSWCGAHSLRFDLDFNGVRPLEVPFRESGTPYQSGEAILKLPQPVDLRGRTVVVHFYVDAPEDVTFDARVLGDDVGRRTGNTFAQDLMPRRWYAISTTFRGFSGVFEPRANVADASHVDGLVVRIDASGDRRTWSGTIYIDDVSWR
jgi:hypothetical protein